MIYRFAAIWLGRDNRQVSPGKEGLAIAITLIALIGKHQPSPADGYVQQRREGVLVGGFATVGDEAKRKPPSVCTSMNFARTATAALTKTLPIRLSFAPAVCERRRTHVLWTMYAISRPCRAHQRFQHGMLGAPFRPSSELDINRVPLAVSFLHIGQGTAHPQRMQHTVEKAAAVLCG